MNWRSLLTIALLLAAIVSGWSAWRQRSDVDAPVRGSGKSGYVLHDFEVIALDSQGQQAFTLRAPTLERNSVDKTMTIATPLFLIPDDSGAEWQLRSTTAWVSADNSEIRLRDKVVGNSPPTRSPAVFKTEQLNAFPEKKLVTSGVLVTVTSPGSTMHGTGMRGHLSDNRIELLSKVRMTYDPSSR